MSTRSCPFFPGEGHRRHEGATEIEHTKLSVSVKLSYNRVLCFAHFLKKKKKRIVFFCDIFFSFLRKTKTLMVAFSKVTTQASWCVRFQLLGIPWHEFQASWARFPTVFGLSPVVSKRLEIEPISRRNRSRIGWNCWWVRCLTLQ